MLGMWDDIKMWLYLRLLDSELRGCLGNEYGDNSCEVHKTKRFRRRENFMKRVQANFIKVYFVWLPFFAHKYFIKNKPEIEGIEITEKTRAIFASATNFQYLQFPLKTQMRVPTFNNSLKMSVTDFSPQYFTEEDKEEIAVSYEKGNRFISWSGLVMFLYTHHWQFVVLLWTVAIYVSGHYLGLFTWICEHNPKIPLC